MLFNFKKLKCVHSQHNTGYFVLLHSAPWMSNSLYLRIQKASSGAEYASLSKAQSSRSYARLLLRPLPIAALLTALGAVQWYRLKKESQEGTLQEAKEWEVTCYCSVPLRFLSRGWGWVSNTELPVKLRPIVYSRYASMFNVNLEEAASDDLTSYPSLSDFFCRPLKDDARPIDFSNCVVSPADGRVLTIGKVTSCKVEQVKGATYSLQTFLGPRTWGGSSYEEQKRNEDNMTSDEYLSSLLENKNNALYQCVVYLAPGDYHRFHSPIEWNLYFRRHFQGELLSVNPTIAQWIPDLFALNERAVYIGRWKHGFFAYAAVGATNVGSIHVHCDEALRTNQRKWRHGEKHRDLFLSGPNGTNLKINKGELFGEFRLGSTIVILFEGPADFQFRIKPGDKILVGESITQCMR